MRKETLHFIRKAWVNTNGTMYLGIPSKIIDRLRLDQNSYLMIELIDDSIMVIKKYNPQFTKIELNKIQNYKLNSNKNKESTIKEQPHVKDDFKNPLDRLENI